MIMRLFLPKNAYFHKEYHSLCPPSATLICNVSGSMHLSNRVKDGGKAWQCTLKRYKLGS